MTGATVRSLTCGDQRSDDDVNVTATCSRMPKHLPPHRGPEVGTGKLVSWGYDFPDVVHQDWPGTRDDVGGRIPHPAFGDVIGQLDPGAEVWTDPDGWTYTGGVRQPDPLDGLWHAVAKVGPVLVYVLAVLIAWGAPAAVVILWRAALR